MNKRKLAAFKKSALDVLSKTKYTCIVWQVYADSCYILDTEEDNVIELCKSEQEAIDCIQGINEESGYKTRCYYKPRLIDKDTGEYITRENLNDYLLKPKS